MKRRTRILTVMCLLAAAGAWLFWLRFADYQSATRQTASLRHAAAANISATNATGTAASKPATLNTNKLAFRLANTTNSFKQLQAAPHAILLANAFIDTEKPLDLKIPAHLKAAGDPGAYIVQARSVTDARFRATLAAAGATEDT